MIWNDIIDAVDLVENESALVWFCLHAFNMKSQESECPSHLQI